MKLTIEIESAGQAMADYPGVESARLLRSIADRVEDASPSSFVGGNLFDLNGNRVGGFSFDGAS